MGDSKDLARKSLEMWAAGAIIDSSIFAPTYRNHQEPSAAGDVGSVDLSGWVTMVEANHRAFPDLRVEVLLQIAEGERVATHWRFTGTQNGPYLGTPATGRAVSWTGVQIDRIADGKIAESWVVWDFVTQLRDLHLDLPA